MNFETEWDNVKIINMNTNYRSTQEIVEEQISLFTLTSLIINMQNMLLPTEKKREVLGDLLVQISFKSQLKLLTILKKLFQKE